MEDLFREPPKSYTFRQYFHQHELLRLSNTFVGKTKEQVDEVDCDLVMAKSATRLDNL